MAQRRLTNQLSERRRPGVNRGHGGRLRPDHRQNARRCLWLRLENSTPSNIKPATVVSASGALLAHDTECPALTIGRWNGSQWLAARITLHRLTNEASGRTYLCRIKCVHSDHRPPVGGRKVPMAAPKVPEYWLI